MKSIEKFIQQYGGWESFFESEGIIVSIDPFNDLLIEHIGKSPNGLYAVSLAFLNHEGEAKRHTELRFEICDLGFYPYYLRNDFEKVELMSYKLDLNGNAIGVRHAIKRKIIEIAETWDEQLDSLEYENISSRNTDDQLLLFDVPVGA